MHRIAEQTSILTSLEEVFAVLVDPANDRRWRAAVESVERLSGAAGAPGAVYRQRVGVPGGTATALVEIVDVAPPRAVTFAVREPVRARGGYELAADGPRVAVRFWLELAPSRGLRAVADRLVAAAIGHGARTDLERLRALLEDSDSADGRP